MASLISPSRFGLSGCLWVFLLLANTVLFMSVWMRGGGEGRGEVQPALSTTTVNQQTGLGKIKWDSQSVVTGTARVGRDFYQERQGRAELVSHSASPGCCLSWKIAESHRSTPWNIRRGLAVLWLDLGQWEQTDLLFFPTRWLIIIVTMASI